MLMRDKKCVEFQRKQNRSQVEKLERSGYEYGIRYIQLCRTTCVLLLLDVQGVLTRTPENVLVLYGQDAVLNCSTNKTAGQNPITWNYDNGIISHEPCKSQSPEFITFPPDSATDCNLRASGSKGHNISGPYRCTENSQRAVAMVIVLGKLHCTVM